jgi:predicted Kef-type K+ transport protein
MKPRDIFGIVVRCTAFFFFMMALQQFLAPLIGAIFAGSFTELMKGYVWSQPISSLAVSALLFCLARPLERLAYPAS